MMKYIRIFFALLYCSAFVLFLTRCSPNAPSLTRDSLRAATTNGNNGGGGDIGGTIVDNAADSQQPALAVKFLNRRALSKLDRERKFEKNDVRVQFSSGDDDFAESLHDLKETGSSTLTLDHSERYYPAEAWIEVDQQEESSVDGCTASVQYKGDNLWQLDIADSSTCASRRDVLDRVNSVTVIFKIKNRLRALDDLKSTSN